MIIIESILLIVIMVVLLFLLIASIMVLEEFINFVNDITGLAEVCLVFVNNKLIYGALVIIWSICLLISFFVNSEDTLGRISSLIVILGSYAILVLPKYKKELESLGNDSRDDKNQLKLFSDLLFGVGFIFTMICISYNITLLILVLTILNKVLCKYFSYYKNSFNMITVILIGILICNSDISEYMILTMQFFIIASLLRIIDYIGIKYHKYYISDSHEDKNNKFKTYITILLLVSFIFAYATAVSLYPDFFKNTVRNILVYLLHLISI